MKNVTTFPSIGAGLLLMFLMSQPCWADEQALLPADIMIPPLTDLSRDLALVAETGKPLVLIFSADHCPFCERLKENIIKPMLRSGDYDGRIILRVTEIDQYETIKGAKGEQIDPPDLAREYGVRVTPTVLLLGADGNEAAPRQLGINNEDYYGTYLDEAIETAAKKIRNDSGHS